MQFKKLKLMRGAFESYYTDDFGADHRKFRKLCFVFKFDAEVELKCYALDTNRDIMHGSEINLTPFDSETIDVPFKIGTIELTYNELKDLIGRFHHVKNDFGFLRFEPKKIQSRFIGYDVFFNDDSTAKLVIRAKNPAPPYRQN